MIRWIAMPALFVALMFCGSQAQASDVRFSVGVGNDGYVYYPNDGYTTYYPYTSDSYGYYTPRYSYSTDANWYGGWYGKGYDHSYWHGSNWDNGRRGSWDGRGSYNGSRGGFVGRGSVRIR